MAETKGVVLLKKGTTTVTKVYKNVGPLEKEQQNDSTASSEKEQQKKMQVKKYMQKLI